MDNFEQLLESIIDGIDHSTVRSDYHEINNLLKITQSEPTKSNVITFCRKYFDILLSYGLFTDESIDGLIQCLDCLDLTEPTDKVYDVPHLGKITQKIYPLIPEQFLFAILIIIILKSNHRSCDVVQQEPIDEGDSMGCIEIISDLHVISCLHGGFKYENYEQYPLLDKNSCQFNYANILREMQSALSIQLNTIVYNALLIMIQSFSSIKINGNPNVLC